MSFQQSSKCYVYIFFQYRDFIFLIETLKYPLFTTHKQMYVITISIRVNETKKNNLSANVAEKYPNLFANWPFLDFFCLIKELYYIVIKRSFKITKENTSYRNWLIFLLIAVEKINATNLTDLHITLQYTLIKHNLKYQSDITQSEPLLTYHYALSCWI